MLAFVFGCMDYRIQEIGEKVDAKILFSSAIQSTIFSKILLIFYAANSHQQSCQQFVQNFTNIKSSTIINNHIQHFPPKLCYKRLMGS